MLFIEREYNIGLWFISQGCSKSRLFITFGGCKIKKIKNYTQKVVFRVVNYRKKEQCKQACNFLKRFRPKPTMNIMSHQTVDERHERFWTKW